MYVIHVHDNGTCSCRGNYQDGHEEWQSPTLAEAVASMKTFAKTMNGTKIKKRKDITYLRPELETKVAWKEFKPFEGK
jgi:hypothetical protein